MIFKFIQTHFYIVLILAVAISFNLSRSFPKFLVYDICMLLISSVIVILLEVSYQLDNCIMSYQTLLNQEDSNSSFI